jgi:hypothetical protein
MRCNADQPYSLNLHHLRRERTTLRSLLGLDRVLLCNPYVKRSQVEPCKSLGTEVDFSMAPTAQGDEIFFHITSQMAARLYVMDLEIFGTSALLASPAVALEYLLAKPPIRVPV